MVWKEYIVLYTHQKTKKAKTWHDGLLKVSSDSKKGMLFDDKGNRLDSLYVAADQVVIGEQLESDRYYIEVDSIKPDNGGENAQSNSISTTCGAQVTKPVQLMKSQPPIRLQPHAPTIGLKRKRTGFNPPRQIKPKVDETTVSYSTNVPQTEVGQNHQVNPTSSDISLASSDVGPAPSLYNVVGKKPSRDCFKQTKVHEKEVSSFTGATNALQVTSFQHTDRTAESPEDVAIYRGTVDKRSCSSVPTQFVPSPWSAVGNQNVPTSKSLQQPVFKSTDDKQQIITDSSRSEATNTKRSASQILALIGSLKKSNMPDKKENERESLASFICNDGAKNRANLSLTSEVLQEETENGSDNLSTDAQLQSKCSGKFDDAKQNTSPIEESEHSMPKKRDEIDDDDDKQGARSPCFDLSFSPLSDVSLTDDEDPTKVTQTQSVKGSQLNSQVQSSTPNSLGGNKDLPSVSMIETNGNSQCSMQQESAIHTSQHNELEIEKSVDFREVKFNSSVAFQETDTVEKTGLHPNSDVGKQVESCDTEERNLNYFDIDAVQDSVTSKEDKMQGYCEESSQFTEGSDRMTDSQLLTCTVVTESGLASETCAPVTNSDAKSREGDTAEKADISELKFSPDDQSMNFGNLDLPKGSFGQSISHTPLDKREMEKEFGKCDNNWKVRKGNCETDKAEGLMDGNEVREMELVAKATVKGVTENLGFKGKNNCQNIKAGWGQIPMEGQRLESSQHHTSYFRQGQNGTDEKTRQDYFLGSNRSIEKGTERTESLKYQQVEQSPSSSPELSRYFEESAPGYECDNDNSQKIVLGVQGSAAVECFDCQGDTIDCEISHENRQDMYESFYSRGGTENERWQHADSRYSPHLRNTNKRGKFDIRCEGQDNRRATQMNATPSVHKLQLETDFGDPKYYAPRTSVLIRQHALPHPNTLRKKPNITKPQTESSDCLAKASEKLDGYVVRGSLVGGAARRQPRNPVNCTFENENTREEDGGNMTDSSFYDMDVLCGRMKPTYYDPKYTMITIDPGVHTGSFQRREEESVSQKVPEYKMAYQNVTEGDQQRVPTNPNQARICSNTVQNTPVHRQNNMPIWMSESPGELSFLDSPSATPISLIPTFQDRRRISRNQLAESLLNLRHGDRKITANPNIHEKRFVDIQTDQSPDDEDISDFNMCGAMGGGGLKSVSNTPNVENCDYMTPRQSGHHCNPSHTKVDELPSPDLFSQRTLENNSPLQEIEINWEPHQNARSISRGFRPPRMINNPTIQNNLVKPHSRSTLEKGYKTVARFQQNTSGLIAKLQIPSQADVLNAVVPQRKVVIPVEFPSADIYKRKITEALYEHLNILLFELVRKYHTALSKVDTSQYQQRRSGSGSCPSGNPVCEHRVPSKMVQVKKDGPNKGRYFYVCAHPRDQQCKFFAWADETQSKTSSTAMSKMILSDPGSITTYFKGQKISLYCECVLLRKVPDSFKKGVSMWVKKRMGIDTDNTKKKLYIKLPRKESSSVYSKDDLWIISEHLDFDSGSTFLAKSSFYGPVGDEVEIEPVSGYYPSNWSNQCVCHALHADNVTTELSCILNINDRANPITLPILPHILNRDSPNLSCDRGFSAPRMQIKQTYLLPEDYVHAIVQQYESNYVLNKDQSSALRSISRMFCSESSAAASISLIHGVFGAGKSYLLAVVVLFLVELFANAQPQLNTQQEPLKLLISSTTNVAVDRILLGLLALGFEEFIRVGSVKKIAKPILPYSVHAAGTDSQELRDLQDMLKSDLTPSEKINVRKSIEQHRKGVNKKKLTEVRVVGVTCAACAFPCLDNFQFQVVLLDECSQMTEPVSMLPVAKFQCNKLVLVGDPKQLDPTIQGSEAAHYEGLEQTLFDRMTKMGYEPTMLKTQYRCHPVISAISNSLFYGGQLRNGICEEDRPPLIDTFPPLCFLDVPGGQEKIGAGGSFFNETEAKVVADFVGILVSKGLEACNIGVITLYKAQMYKVQMLLQDSGDARAVQVSTVDAFQGGERGIIVLSCVRSHNVGFIDSDKRMNVALTRAKNHLFIVGNKRNLNGNRLWRKVVEHCAGVSGGIQSAEKFIQEIRMAPATKKTNLDKGQQDTYRSRVQPKKHSGRRTPLGPVVDNSQSPPLDLWNSSQESTSSENLQNQKGASRLCNQSSVGVDFLCGLDYDSSQSSCAGNKRPRLVVSDGMSLNADDVSGDRYESDTDSELQDANL